VLLAPIDATFTHPRAADYSHAAACHFRDIAARHSNSPMEGTMAIVSYHVQLVTAAGRHAFAARRRHAYASAPRKHATQRRVHSISCILAIAALALSLHTQAFAENFRIETKIFVGEVEEDEKPASETTTLFHDGVVYDFLKSPAQTAVFFKPSGKNAGRFILLNDEHQVRTEISTKRLAGAMENLRTWAGRQSDPFLKFAANPSFEESFEPGNGQLILASHLESYTVDTAPAKHPAAAREYREFLDWYAQLNTLLTAGPPPQPRLKLNAALTRYKAIPKSVTLTRAGQDNPLRAEHAFTWLLSQDDLARIEEVRAAQVSYRSLENQEYLRLSRPTENE
jgi:hypothetical protein